MKNWIKLLSIAILLPTASTGLLAGEGMWLPLLLKALNESEMQSMGMKMTAEDIYSVNRGSLKDAIVHFGGFCTSELISDQGLLLTNHHCGYGAIQSHTSLENNYIRDGFWARSLADELPNPSLSATFIVRIEDVSEKMLKGVTDKLSEKERQSMIDKNMAALKESFALDIHEELVIRPFFKGNQYFAFVTMTYNDVRLVGAPPEMIGKFGSDTDNWVWPRHTGDFALFRIYAGADNMPAEYSEDNVPYKPKHFLPISLDGVAPDDFTLVFGFPGRTNQYLPSFAVEQTVDVLNPAKIGVRDIALKIVDAEMRADAQVKIQYASKFARIANYWKKWIGESQGLKATDGVGRKQRMEDTFTQRLQNNPQWQKKYGDILPQFRQHYKEIETFALMRDYYGEIIGRNIEIMRIVGYLNNLTKRLESNDEAAYLNYRDRLINYFEGFYKDYQSRIDQKVFAALMEHYVEKAQLGIADPVKGKLILRGNMDYAAWAKDIYAESAIPHRDRLMAILDKTPGESVAALQKDPLFMLYSELSKIYQAKVSETYEDVNGKINRLQRLYMEALMEVFPEKRFYPDANSTMRVTYGKVNGYEPRDAVTYTPVTYLDGVMEKYVPGDYEFDVPQKLQELYISKDYGQYADKNGKMPVCFIGSNHTTGGNSGSPAIDAHGNLIGLNFDRVWEGTMSDINYDASICRNIMVDIRYVLFIVDKYAGAQRLIDEMKLVHPKKNQRVEGSTIKRKRLPKKGNKGRKAATVPKN